MDQTTASPQAPAPQQPEGRSQKNPAGIAIFVLVLVLVIGGALYALNQSQAPTGTYEDAAVSGGEAPVDAANTYTLAQVAEHDTPADCWLALSGKVYDVTAFIASGKHGGGDAILQGCGKDATELYETRPMGSGTPHSDVARSYLPNFEIGTLAQ